MNFDLRFVSVAVLCLAAVVTLPAVASAYDGFIAPIAEIPLTAPAFTGARSLGMGGAAFAVVDDASALSSNPAALARLQRIEVSGGLSMRRDDLTGNAFGDDFETSLTRTDVSALRFAYPFPTFRGSLVIGLSGERVYGFDDDFLAVYEDTITWEESEDVYLTGPWGQIEDSRTEGGIYAWTLGAAVDASPNVSLGAAVSYWAGDFTRRFSWSVEDVNGLSDTYDSYQLNVLSSSDVYGLRVKLGGLFYTGESIAIGVVLDTPAVLTFDGSETESVLYNGEGDTTYTTYFSDKLELPFAFGAGVALTPIDMVLVAGDVYYTDWSQMTHEGLLYLEDPVARRNAYEATVEFRLGAEVTVPSWPLRLRGGYMSRPIAYRGLDIDTDRSYFTFGAGLLIDTVLTLDVAWMEGTHERSGPDYDYSESVDDSALLIEATYRF